MGVFIVIAVILCAPFMLFSPDLDSEAKFMAFVISIGFSLPLFLFIFNLFNEPVSPEDKKKISIHGIQLAKKLTRAGVFSVVWIFSKKTVSRRTAATVSTRHRST